METETPYGWLNIIFDLEVEEKMYEWIIRAKTKYWKWREFLRARKKSSKMIRIAVRYKNAITMTPDRNKPGFVKNNS